MTNHTPSARGNSGDWIREALERNELPLMQYATRVLGGDVDRARDVVQETFLRLCNQKREDVAEHLTEWLFKVCRNQALDVYRKESRMSTLSEEQAKQTVDANASPASAMEREDELSLVLGCLDRLPDKQQEVLRLKFQHGLSYKEIARVTEESIGNVGWLIHQGIKGLRQRLAGDESMKGAEA